MRSVNYALAQEHGWLPWEVDRQIECEDWNYLFFDWLKAHSDLDCRLGWNMSMLSYFRITDEHEPDIYVKVPKMANASMQFHAYYHGEDGAYYFGLWKYNGKHVFKNIELQKLSKDDFPRLLEQALLFFGLRTHKPQQMSIFDFM